MRATALLTLLFAWPASAATLRGTVRAPSGPLAGAEVRVTIQERGKPNAEKTQTTASTGAFSFDIAAGEFVSVAVVATPPPALSLASDSVFVPFRGDTEVRLALTPFVRISGTVAGGPAGMRVELHSMSRIFNQAMQATPDFTFNVPADVYSVLLRSSKPPYLARRNIDARGGDVTGIALTPGATPERIVFDDAPDATRITIGAPDENGVAQIRGAAGAVPPLSAISIVNLESSSMKFTISNADGSFGADLFAPAGSSIQVRCDRTGLFLFDLGNTLTIPPATIIRVPALADRATVISSIDESAITQIAPYELARTGSPDAGRWVFETVTPAGTWTPGSKVTIAGKLTLYSKNLAAMESLSAVTIDEFVALAPLFDRHGMQRPHDALFMSSTMTPTGLPIERQSPEVFPPAVANCGALTRRAPERADAQCSFELDVPAAVQPAIYRPFVNFVIRGIPSAAIYFDGPQTLLSASGHRQTYLPSVAIGAVAAPRLFWTLLTNDFSNGSRGAVALQDQGKFSFASHVVTNTPRLIVPRGTYRLEPFVPMISSTENLYAEVPQIPFRFPSGSLRVRVVRPDGAIDDLGESPFRQSTSHGHATPSARSISTTSKHVVDVYQLTTNDPRFRYTFPIDGTYRIEMTGTIDDVYGHSYAGGGTYEVEVGNTIDIDTAVIAGTPFIAGDAFTPALHLDPAVRAQVRVTLDYWPASDPAKRIVKRWDGTANRFGFFTGESIRLSEPGEYRVDVVATWTSEDGERWAGAMTAGSVVATPDSAIETHGRRGFDSQPAIGRQWFFVRDDRAGPDHVMFPFHSGDVIWLEDTGPPNVGGSAVATMVSLHDPIGALAARVKARKHPFHVNWQPPSSLDERIAAGEIPILSTAGSDLSASFDPERIDQWGYVYVNVERPGVHVRELVTEDSASAGGYWRFSENYHFQLGNGVNGDLPNDFKFQFGGAVWRDLGDGFNYYGAYASLFVLLPHTGVDEGRVFPPFHGDGGPLLTLKGKAIDIFFHPTAVRAGTILHRGDRVMFAGYSAPALSSKVEITVTSPSGVTRRIAGQANRVGYFHDPAQDFFAGESGVWKAKVKIVFDGSTSNGQLTAPFPTGDVPGSREGEFFFYVVDGDAPQLELAPLPQFVRPADGPITFTLKAPPGWTNVQVARTTAMPGFILEEATTLSLTYIYDAQALARDFPNLDLHDDDGATGVDTIAISFLLSGIDAQGRRSQIARAVVIQGEALHMPEQPPRPKRRAAR